MERVLVLGLEARDQVGQDGRLEACGQEHQVAPQRQRRLVECAGEIALLDGFERIASAAVQRLLFVRHELVGREVELAQKLAVARVDGLALVSHVDARAQQRARAAHRVINVREDLEQRGVGGRRLID